MEQNKEILVNIFKHEIVDFAYFEDRRFLKSFQKRYIFIRKKYLKEQYPSSVNAIGDYCPVITPISLSEEERDLFVPLVELKSLVQNDTYNHLLKDLLNKADGFDQINIVFDNIFEFKEFNTEIINDIINTANNSWAIKNSFQVKDKMPQFILNHIHLVNSNNIIEFLHSFPRPNNLLTEKSKISYLNTINKINMKLGDKSQINSSSRKVDLKMINSGTFNDEIQGGMDELRKWDSEDSSWRVANDID